MKQKREQQKKRRWIFGVSALGVFGLCMILAIVGMGNSLGQLREAEVAQSPTVLLASAGVKEGKTVSLPVIYYDQISDLCVDLKDESKKVEAEARQWEWNSCGYQSKKIEQGLASEHLNEQGLPEATGEAEGIPNANVNFEGWFEAQDGISEEIPGTLQLQYEKDGAVFSFSAKDFYPLDDVKFSEGDPVNADGHNKLFTMSFAVPFSALLSGEEAVAITADDDTFVYLDGQLVLDMGGIHGAATGELVVDQDGQVYQKVNNSQWLPAGVKLQTGAVTKLEIFHADRDSKDSEFEIQFSGMNLLLNEGTQIAAITGDGSEYTAPLGESKVFQPDTMQATLLIATIEGVLVVAVAVLTVIVARYVIRQRQE